MKGVGRYFGSKRLDLDRCVLIGDKMVQCPHCELDKTLQEAVETR